MASHAIELIRKIRATGFNQEQAEVIAEGISEAVQKGAATKADIVEFKGEIKADIARLESEVRAKFTVLTSLIIGIILLLVAQFFQ